MINSSTLEEFISEQLNRNVDYQSKERQIFFATPQGRYLIEIKVLLQEITLAYSHLKMAIILMGDVQTIGQSQKKGIPRSYHLVYHLENFYIRLDGIFDRVLHLVDGVFELGNKPKYVKFQLVTQNRHVKKREAIIQSLKKINKFVVDYKTKRNPIIHEQSHKPEEPSFKALVLFESMPDHIETPLRRKQFSEQYLVKFINEKQPELTEIANGLLDQLLDVLDNLTPEVEKRFDEKVI